MPVDVKITNNAFGQLTVGISPTDTTITVGAGEGARFPTLTGSEYFYATLADQSNLLEIVKVTARSTNTFTVLRGQDNTTAKSYTAGDRIELRPNAALFEDLIVQSRTADVITYDNNASGLTATDVQAAIDEVEGRVDSVETGKVAKTSDTGAALLPVGTTAERPASPEAGMMRFNTDEGYVEWYDDIFSEWFPTSLIPVFATGGTVTEITQGGFAYRVHTFTSDGTFEVVRGGEVEYLVVAGGGGGGKGRGGGGGAGGLLTDSKSVSVTSYSLSVGAGGSAGTTSSGFAGNGDNSSGFGVTAIGGGGGRNGGSDGDGTSGGSGGGATGSNATSGSFSGGDGTAGQGNRGGNLTDQSTYRNIGSGGGGAGSRGADQPADGGDDRVNGGAGLDLSGVFGTGVGDAGFFSGGGGGGANDDSPVRRGLGGAGGGGEGSASDGIIGESGQANTGGGGGGGGGNRGTGSDGGAGGSGIVIVRYRIG